MNKLYTKIAVLCFGLCLAITSNVWSQAPEKFNYQAVVRDGSGEIMSTESVSLRIAILSGSATGTEVYSEEHSVTTNDFGLVNFQIGDGSNQSGDIGTIDWGADSYFVQVGLDPNGGTSFTTMGVSQLLSVPYALYAGGVSDVDDADADPANELQFLSFANDTLSISDGNSIVISQAANLDNDSTNELQTISIAGDTIALTDGGSIVLPPVAANLDNDSTNELQTLSIAGDTISLTDGGSVVLPPVPVNNDNDSTNELNTAAALNGTNLEIEDAGGTLTVDLSSLIEDDDADSTNELQSISYSNDTLMLDNGGGDVVIRESRWDDGIDAILYNGGTVGIGTDTADTNASLDLGGMDKPMILPQMSLLDILNFENPVDGMYVFCTTVGCPYYYADSNWYSNCNADQNNGGGLLAGNAMGGTSAGGTSYDYGYDVAMDEDGNKYVTGYFQGTATFGGSSLTSSGGYDIFVMKVDTTDSIVWATKMGGTSSDYGYSIAVDDNGSVYVTGHYYNSGTFGSTTLSGSYNEVFLVKMSASTGAVTWAIDGGGSSNDYGRGVAVDDNGNVYVTGYFYSSATFGSYTQYDSYYGVFVAKANSSGTWQWLSDAGGSYYQYGEDIACDDNGNCIVVGRMSKSTSTYFGSNYAYASGYYYYYYAGFIAKINSSGAWQWVEELTGYYYGNEYLYGVDMDDNGDAYVCGYSYEDYFTYDGSTEYSGNTYYAPFVMKVDGTDGDKEWVGFFSGEAQDYGYVYPQSVAVTDDGYVFVAGYTQYGIDYDGISDAAGTTNSYNAPFMVMMDDEGSGLGAAVGQQTGTYHNYGYGVDAIGIDKAVSTGNFRSPEIEFGNTTVSNSSSSGYSEIFVWSYDLGE